MSEPTSPRADAAGAPEPPPHQPFVPPTESPPEFTLPAVLAGTVLGIVFGASSLYLVLKVGLTVSASVPIAVLSITLFRAISKAFNIRKTTILENNVVQTAGSAGESIAFGVGVTMPALLLLGFEMDPVRVMTVSVLGAVLGILMMIPLRRAFIVKQHGKLVYPEGTACAEVLVAGEKGGATAKMVFVGFGVALVYKFLMSAGKLWSSEPATKLYAENAAGGTTGLKGAQVSGELSPELLGVGYLIGPRIACLMMAGAVLSYFVLGPTIAAFGEKLPEPVAPAMWDPDKPKDESNPGLIRNMEPDDLRAFYLRYIGAGAVAAGGIISMCRALPLIFGSIAAGLRDLRASRAAGGGAAATRTDRDMPMTVVLWGSVALVLALAAVPQLGLGLNPQGLLGAGMILLFGFLFVTVSSRLTGEVGSSSNPISGMTIATLLLVCLIFLILGRTGTDAMLTALTVAAVVCIASSNGGTTSQDLKTGYLVGATPSKQQWAILIGAVTSALVIGLTMLALNAAQTHFTKKGFAAAAVLEVPAGAPAERPGRPYTDDPTEYRVVHVRANDYEGLAAGRYLVNAAGNPVYRTDVPISREAKVMDNGEDAPPAFVAPQPRLFANIIEGILRGTLEWSLIVTGVMVAVALELCGVSALPVAVGMYLSLGSSMPIFIGGMARWVTDLLRGKPKSDAESETSPGVLLASGLIAGGTLCGLCIAFLEFDRMAPVKNALNVGALIFGHTNDAGKVVWKPDEVAWAKVASVVMFGLLAAALVIVGTRKEQKPPV
ncbi:peptide transporter : Oligopeptide transporter, OPT family OS=Isosphaera pallida (strain ATCC 43644 / DSM 9630 / IS1B) GN=Isop_2665 PE=4 SV=1: OPT: OPT [Gemmataceae bacterium]|nr:peptide transporter : Oligopeptide transporter, OPT family OS=Isosphaera pallida (strain ATCC 43644 / DSM 9630 / IS1B) GN=Isop_2665 PE=4 SV=1: OPT: OPT [Gemmataceae bacterium]VTU01914.1 peptide transporter : Oligopeptide transporter, OPT family OS=Isosphaera pallida (strain ATCC 43644 / DSM 9630 / IS1B) GN=Isop_2665 PE=4 SV=1: OPT: OPT [Gemmataceae bacterium]